METIILIFIGVFILFRIYKVLKEIHKIVKNPKFKKGLLITVAYIVTFINMIGFIFSLNELASTLDSEILSMISILLGTIVLIVSIIIMKYLFKEYEEVKLPFKLILLILTLGLLIYSAYSISNSGKKSNDKEFVNPHEVNGYTRKDGSTVSGYWRDGDGNPETVVTKENGGGYWRNKNL